MILPADKGKVTVVMDKLEYCEKLRTLLDEGPYTPVQRDPGPKLRRELHKKLTPAFSEQRISRTELLRLCPTHYQTPHIYGLPKIHKPGVPLRPIVSMRDSLLSSVSRRLADIMAPFVSQCDSYVKDSEDLVLRLSERSFTGGCFASLDVVSLFTNVPVKETLEVFRQLLCGDDSLSERTPFSVEEILDLSSFVLSSCYFRHFDGLFQQNEGATMGSSLGPVAANLFMAHLETLAFQMALDCDLKVPSLWLRFVDDVLIFWPHSEEELLSFVNFVNEMRPSIHFNLDQQTDGQLPFLDVCIHYSGSEVSFSVYRKPTHTDLYLRRDSAHPRSVFKGILSALGMRAQRVCSKKRISEERRHLRNVFRRNGYDDREISRGLRVNRSGRSERVEGRRHALPYFPGTSERIAKALREVGVLASMKPISTLKSMLVRKRPESPRIHGAVYDIACSDCSWNYVGETGRTIEERRREHHRAVKNCDVQRSEVARHAIEEGHRVRVEEMKIIEKESNWKRRVIKEALWTRKLEGSNKVNFDISGAWRF